MRNFLIGCAPARQRRAWPRLCGASAQDLELEIGRDGPRIERDWRDCNPRYEDCYRYERRGYYEDCPRCSEGRALRKAERMGIRRASYRRHRPAHHRCKRPRPLRRPHPGHLFGRQPSCPVLSDEKDARHRLRRAS